MAEVRFYHLQKQNLDQALPLILEKVFQTKKNCVVRMADEKEVARMNDILWSYKQQSFLPHGYSKTGDADLQPIWLTHQDDNPNAAKIMVLTQGVTSEEINNYDLTCEMLDGHDTKAIETARQRWKIYKEKGFDVTYWHQKETGAWEKKA